VLEEAARRLLDKALHHGPEDRRDREEPLVRLADVLQAQLVQQDLLDNERRHLRQKGAPIRLPLHTERTALPQSPCELHKADNNAAGPEVSSGVQAKATPNPQQHERGRVKSIRTVFESSFPASIMRKLSGMISVDSRKLMTSESSVYMDGQDS
jgi:hypothetical protein